MLMKSIPLPLPFLICSAFHIVTSFTAASVLRLCGAVWSLMALDMTLQDSVKLRCSSDYVQHLLHIRRFAPRSQTPWEMLSLDAQRTLDHH